MATHNDGIGPGDGAEVTLKTKARDIDRMIQAASDKGLDCTVAGVADILIVPNIEAGNMPAKQLTFLGRADAAGVVLGAAAPIILTGRADRCGRSWRLAPAPC